MQRLFTAMRFGETWTRGPDEGARDGAAILMTTPAALISGESWARNECPLL